MYYTQYHTKIVEAAKSELSKPVETVIEESLSALTGGLSPKELNQQFLQKHPDSLDHLIHGEPHSFHVVETSILFCHAGARVLYRLQPELRDKAVGYITDLSDQLKGRTLEVQACNIQTSLWERGVSI